MKKRILSFLLSLIMLIALFPATMTVYAATSGTCGANLTWTLDDSGTLTITGSGKMTDYRYSNYATFTDYSPFYENRDAIKKVIIGNDVTSIGTYAFYYCNKITNIEIGEGVTSIGNYAFGNCTSLAQLKWNAVSVADFTNDSKVFDGGTNASTFSVVFGDKVKKIPAYAFYTNWASSHVRVKSIQFGNSVTSIGTYAFGKCSDLTSIELPDNITSIGNYAFYKCTGLTSVKTGDGATKVGEYAFSECSNLTKAKIGDKVTSIGTYAFNKCSKLESVTIGKSVTSIASYAFTYCNKLTLVNYKGTESQWNAISKNSGNNYLTAASINYNYNDIVEYITYTTIDGKVTIQSCNTGIKGVVIIPTYIGGYPVTTIGSNAFKNCTGMTSITIPSCVTRLESQAFNGCNGLVKVNITDLTAWCNVSISASYYSNPLEYAKKLYLNGNLVTSLVIPSGVAKVPDYAFSKCTSITSVTIPNSVTDIGNYAFLNCTGLTSVTFPDSVKIIGPYAFSGCAGLTSVNMGKGVTSVGRYAFDGCTKLAKVNVTDLKAWCNIDFYHSTSNPLYYAKKLYLNGSLVTNLTIPSGTTKIGDFAFCNCTGITSVTIPNSVTSTGRNAFYNCTGLTKVNISDLKAWCNIKFTEMYLDPTANPLYYAKNLYLNGTLVTNLTIPTGVTSINANAFCGCTSITNLTIPSGLATISSDAFYNCTSLKSVTLGKDVTSIGSGAFENCTGLTNINWNAKNISDFNGSSVFAYAGQSDDGVSVVFGNDVERIPAYAFYTGLTAEKNNIISVTLSSKTTSIGDKAFYNCSSIKNVNITDIKAYLGCEYSGISSNPMSCYNADLYLNGEPIINLVIPEGITKVPAYAFYGCSELKSVTIPKSLTEIGYDAFTNCNLSSLYISDVASWCNISSSSFLYYDYLYLNDKMVTDLVIPEGVTQIPKYAFSSCDGLKSITIPDSVTSIGNNAFYSCTGLTSVTIPDSVANIGSSAFEYCRSLKNIILGRGLTNIGYCAFESCSALTNIILPENITSIDGRAFYDCYNLTSITIPAGVTSIGNSAFGNCRKLQSVHYNGTANEWNTIQIGTTNEPLTNATLKSFWYLNVYDSQKNLINKIAVDDGTLADISSFEQIEGNSIKLYTDEEGTTVFDYLNTPINQNYDLYLGYSANQYTHKFLNDDGTVLKESSVDYGTTITAPVNPTKPADDQYTYTFAGWGGFEEGITQKAEEMVFTAKYDKTVNQYSYHFVDEDGTVLKEATVDYGAEIVPPENPTKQGSAQYSYTFTGWDGFTGGMTQTAEDLYFYATYSASVNQYTYKFVDWDGTVLKEKMVNYNTMITPPSNPSKAPDAQFTYAFAGWDGYTVGMKATGDVTFTATYSNTVNQYTYKFVDALGNTILEKTVDYGTVIELPQEEITKAPDDEFTYTFTGWDGYTEDMTVTGNITFAPLFSKTTNKYSYQFVDEDGTVLKEDTVDYGTVITPSANPSKEADAQYTYTFKGWKGFTEGIKQTAETMVFTAEYNATVNQYTYKFVDEDGSVIKTQTVDYGTAITPPGNPSKASTDQYSYKFIGWSGYTDGMTVTKDETFKATYEEITNQYTYKFVDYAGNIVKEATVDYGTVIVTPATPDGYSDQQYTYIFASWTGYVRGMKVTKDITFNARYTSVLNQYTYVFMDENGNLLSEDTVDYGTKITPPEAPAKDSTVQYSYEFAGWENYTDGVIVDDVIFIATYKPITNKYTYRFENEDGTEIKTVTADYGSIIEVPRNPQKEATAQYSYKFAGWGGYRDGMTLTGNVTFKATYTSIINQYTYKFTDEDGEVLKELTVDYGTKIVVPDTTPQKDADVQYTYTFKEWNGYTDGMTVTSDVTFVAVYDSILNQYTYKFVNEDGSLVKEQKADYGSVIILPATPSKDATQQYSYKFIGWDGYTDGMTVAGDVVFTAKYTPVINQYTYVFKNEDGTEIKSVTADYGTDIIVPEDPTKASTVQYSYTFASWSNYINGMSLTEDITFVATYTSTLNQYTYKFVDNDGTELKSATVDYGAKIVAPSAPADKGAYTFDYWDGFTDGMTVAGDVTFKAVYKYKTYNISVDGYEISSNATYGEKYVITPAEKYGYDFVGYYTEVDGNGTKLTDSEGNSLNAYEYEKDITVYPYFADLLVNKAVLSGATSMQVGDTDVKYTLTLGTDRENITYATVFVKYPNSLSISKLEKKADIAEVIQEKSTLNGEYTTTEIIVIYSDDKAMPIKTPIEVFDIYFNVSKTADTKNIAISLTNNSVLMDSTSDYRFAELVGANATIKVKFPESISIEGEVVIDSPTKYTAIVTPDYATYDVEWSVNDASIASITADGILTPIKNGTVIIIAKSLNNPEVFATREITVKAYAKVASITTDGFWTEEFANDIKEYTVYVDEDTTEFNITPVSASGGRFKINGSTVFSNRTETISLDDDEKEVVITLTGATGYTDNTYVLTVIKNSDALITEFITTESGYEFDIILNKDKIESFETAKIVVALYDSSNKFIGLTPVPVNVSETKKFVPIVTETPAYTAKVMLWNGLETLKPLCNATGITLK